MSPEATKIDVRLWHARVCDEEPEAEDWFGKDIEDGVGDDFAINAEGAGSPSDAPNTAKRLAIEWIRWLESTYTGYAVQTRIV